MDNQEMDNLWQSILLAQRSGMEHVARTIFKCSMYSAYIMGLQNSLPNFSGEATNDLSEADIERYWCAILMIQKHGHYDMSQAYFIQTLQKIYTTGLRQGNLTP